MGKYLRAVNKICAGILAVLIAAGSAAAQQKYSAVVSLSGMGEFSSIQAAIDSAPANQAEPFTILIKKGIYREKIYIEKSNIVLVGEDRDSTSIVYAELRRNWHRDHAGNDRGAAVINISNEAADIIIANLRVYNDYGSAYPADPNARDHQFAVRGGGTRVAIVNCLLKADGGDTVSLWNSISGMYYLSFCRFEGWVDYVCPRGWCYISDSEFYGHNMTASIWHDGSMDESQKFVIKDSYFDGVKGFPLGRNHRDAQFILYKCRFSSNMADRPIYRARPDSMYQWPERCYFYSCSREGGDYGWFKDNLKLMPGLKDPAGLSAVWTFGGRWNPESPAGISMPLTWFPTPAHNSAVNSAAGIQLSWSPVKGASEYIVYLYETGKPARRIWCGSECSCSAGILSAGCRYVWHVKAVTAAGSIEGPRWIFSVRK